MTKFHIEWKKEISAMPDDPAKIAKLNLSLLDTVKADLKAGKLSDWGVYCNGFSGYCIIEGTEADVLFDALKYMPYVVFDVKPAANVDQAIEAINITIAESKPK